MVFVRQTVATGNASQVKKFRIYRLKVISRTNVRLYLIEI